MKRPTSILLAASIASLSMAGVFEWQDNSDNEEGFELRGTSKAGVEIVAAMTAMDIERATVSDTSSFDSMQVFAFVFDWDGNKLYSGGSNVLLKPTGPMQKPSGLRARPRQASARINKRRGR